MADAPKPPPSGERHLDRLARWAREGKEGAPPVPAATVVLLRNGPHGIETLMLRRSSKIAFGGLWVFPGGRVDAEDADGLAADDELGAARAAAVREAKEEAGLDVEPSALAPLSHWTPPPITPRRFLTWIFVAEAPAGEVTIDGGEIREHAWMSALAAFERRDAGEIEIAPPTWVTLYTLSRFESVAVAMAAVRAREPERFATHIAVGDEGPIAMWQGDAGWKTSDARAAGPRHRLSMHAEKWRYERNC
jgi:8-oxo-dGTP pyrophosphatase MutT (NUDIX family)